MTARFNLPVWLKNGPEVTKLADAFGEYWDKVEGWIKTPLSQLDAETCHITVLKLMAYQRDVNRFAGEPDDLFRKRVAFAVQNAQSAGSPKGFKEIFERFDLPLLGQIERDPEKDWDVITLWLGDSTITKNPELGQYLVRQYGRTCRRYHFLLVDFMPDLHVQGNAASVDRQANNAIKVPDWVFKDMTDTTHFTASSGSVERVQSVPMAVAPYAFHDRSGDHSLGFYSASVERYTDTIRGF
uniref:Phage tail protein n=1 Tax=Marinomonas sp. (strain MWYL1) TaxID=400668 RepID=A6VSS7_MARMS